MNCSRCDLRFPLSGRGVQANYALLPRGNKDGCKSMCGRF